MINFDSKKIEKVIPAIIKNAIDLFRNRGFTPIAVGGIVRDYLLNGTIGSDWDFEIHHPSMPFNRDLWKDLGKELGQLGKVTFLNFEVLRLEGQNYQMEFSPPRNEIFFNDWQNLGHSNFSAEFDFRSSFHESFKRRDFTINAIGMRFDGDRIELIDPFEGILHLRDKTLHSCSDDFIKDPVRFFRAIRFSLKFKFHFSTELEKKLREMPVHTLSPPYLWSEMNKSSDPVGYLELLLKWQRHHPKLSLPVEEVFLSKLDKIRPMLKIVTRHEMWLIALESVGLSSQKWQEYFGLSLDQSKRFSRWSHLSKEFQEIKPEIFHGEFENIIKLQGFEKLFDWYFTTKQLLQKYPDLPLMEMIEVWLPDWIHLYRFDPLKDVKHIDPPLRAKYQVWNLCQRL